MSCPSCSETYPRLRILLFPPAPPRMTRILAGRVRSSAATRTFGRPDLLAKSQIVPVVQPQAGQARSGTDKLQDGQLGTASKERLSKAKLIKKVYVEDVEYRKPKRVTQQTLQKNADTSPACKRVISNHGSHLYSTQFAQGTLTANCFNTFQEISLQNPWSIKARTPSVLEPAPIATYGVITCHNT